MGTRRTVKKEVLEVKGGWSLERYTWEEETEGERRLFIGGDQHGWPVVMVLRCLGAIS